MDALSTMEKLVGNVAKAPTELKFRRLRLSNPKITEVIVDTPNALDALQALGWEAEDDQLVLPITRQLTYAHVRPVYSKIEFRAELACVDVTQQTPAVPQSRQGCLQVRVIQEAQERLKKVQKDAKRSKAASKATLTKDQQQLRAQMEADRRERASQGPSLGSKAQALPTGECCHAWVSKICRVCMGVVLCKDVILSDQQSHRLQMA